MDRIQEVLNLSAPPIAIGFSDEPPAGLERWPGGAVPAGCVFSGGGMKRRGVFNVSPAPHHRPRGGFPHPQPLPPPRGTPPAHTLPCLAPHEDIRAAQGG